MKRILSVDFDYFINADAETRESCFPYAIEERMSKKKVNDIWNRHYNMYPEIRDIGLIPDYNILMNDLTIQDTRYMITDSHKELYSFIHSTTEDTDEEIYIANIDFHHDFYYMYGGEVTCANWLMKICSEYPNKEIIWVAREDSEIGSLGGDFPYRITHNIRDVLTGDYDAIFLCYSPEWTPPHLSPFFNDLAYRLL